MMTLVLSVLNLRKRRGMRIKIVNLSKLDVLGHMTLQAIVVYRGIKAGRTIASSSITNHLPFPFSFYKLVCSLQLSNTDPRLWTDTLNRLVTTV